MERGSRVIVQLHIRICFLLLHMRESSTSTRQSLERSEHFSLAKIGRVNVDLVNGSAVSTDFRPVDFAV